MTSRLIFKAFKTRGLSLTAGATQALESVLSREDDVEGSMKLILDELKDRIDKREVTTRIIDVDTITNIVADLSSNDEDVAQEKYQILDAFSTPKLHYDDKNKSFKMIQSPSYQLFGDVESRANMYRERLLITQQRLFRSEMFTLKGLKSKGNQIKATEISTIESLLGSSGKKVLFGMLTQPEEGTWYLEDLTSTIQLDLSQTKKNDLFYTEGSQVIVEGEVIRQNVFLVHFIVLPPLEERETTIRTLGIHDIFNLQQRQQHYHTMLDMEKESNEELIIILSEIYLDKPLIIEKLSTIFDGFEKNGITPLYIMIGSFFMKSYFNILNGKQIMKQCYDSLANCISQYPLQCNHAKFLFIPGPLDAGMNIVLPRKPIPNELMTSLKEQVKHVKCSTNPCRFRCFTQEIVIYRQDLLKKMQRHLVLPLRSGVSQNNPDEGDDENDDGEDDDEGGKRKQKQGENEESIPDITEQLAESILDQGHLSPLPLHAQPIIWELDYVMRLFPLPHLLVLADKTDQYSYGYKSCNVVNPGTFSSDFSFIVYQPASKSIQFSRVPET